MAAKKKGSVVSLVRKAGQDVKRGNALGGSGSDGPQIYDILSYIELPWGLNMRLYPTQRFLVKLYYNLPLDEDMPEELHRRIQVRDMFGEKVLHTFSEKEYLRYLYNEGRCNIGEQDHDRRELVLAIGRRAGKCCRENTYVFTSNGLQEIQTLGDPGGAEYQPLQINVAQEGVRRATSTFFYNGGVRDTVRVRSRCGYEIEGTPNHRVRVLTESGTIEWRFLGDMCVGDQIGIHRRTDLWAETLVDTTPYQKELPGGKCPNLPTILDEDWGTLLGVLVGGGSWTAGAMVEVTVGPYPEWLAQVEHLFQATLGDAVIYPEPERPRVFRVRLYSTPARHFLDRLGFKIDVESHTKRVPWAIMRSPKTVVAAFLRGLFETGGSAERGGRSISFSTASAKLASEVQLLLLNFGIISRVKPRLNKKYGKTYYHITVLGADSVRIFSEQIGFFSERKTSLLRAHVVKGYLGNKSPTESIPHQRVWCRRLVESVPKNNGNVVMGKLGWRRSLLRAAFGNVIKNTTDDLSYPRLRAALAVAREVGADQQVIKHFTEILDAGYFYDEVAEIHQDRGRVYDLVVPDGASFVANGMTNHNTTLSGIFASYEIYRLLNLYNPQEYYGLPNGNRIQLISVATDKDQASLLFNEVSSHLAKCEYFTPYVCNNTQGWINFRTPYDIEKYGPNSRHDNGKFVSFNGKATLRVTFKSCIAKGLRGAGNIVIILDEVAHFQDKGNSSAGEIYDAVTPSSAAFSRKDAKTGLPFIDKKTHKVAEVESRIILISSPLGRSGKFYERFDIAMRGGEAAHNLLAIQAPTWEVNPTIPPSYYREKCHADPVVYMTEHGAQFNEQVRGWIERKEDLLSCIDPQRRPVMRGRPRVPHYAGIDVGLIGDGTCIAITHIENNVVVLDYHELWQAGVPWKESNPHLAHENPPTEYAKHLESEARLDFDEICAWIEVISKRFYIERGLFDRWNGIPLEQALHKKGYTRFESEFFTRDMSSKIYQTTKMYLFDHRISLYDYPIPETVSDNVRHSPLIAELFSLQAKQISKNLILVEAPQRQGAHDDMSDALVRSIWLCTQAMSEINYAAQADTRPRVARTNFASYQRMKSLYRGAPDRQLPRSIGRTPILGGPRGR